MSDEPDNVVLMMLRQIEAKLDLALANTIAEKVTAALADHLDRIAARLDAMERLIHRVGR